MTPNPTVTKMYQQPAASAVDEFLELRMASKTPPPSHLSSNSPKISFLDFNMI